MSDRPLFLNNSPCTHAPRYSMTAIQSVCSSLTVVLFFLFAASVPHVAGAELAQAAVESGVRTGAPQGDSSSAFTPEAPQEACRECGGLRFYPPSTSRSEAASGIRQENPPGVGTPSDASSIQAHLSSDPRVKTARALIHRNRFAEALEILLPLRSDHPDQTDVRFLMGLAASRWSQEAGVEEEKRRALLDAAISSFRSILIRRPGLVRVRLELALAFYLKEEDALAQDHFERALVGRPPEALVANINRFLKVMRARRRWNAYFGFSIAPDTNINAASDAEFIYIQGLPFRRGQTGRASSDVGVVGWGGAEYQYPLAERWRLRSGININHREYKGNRWDQTFISGYVGPRWLINQTTEVSLLATASQRWWGGSSLSYDYGARLEAEHRLYAGLRLSGRALWSDRKYQQQKFLEGPLMVFSLGVNYVPLPIMQVSALVGYQQQEAALNRWNSAGYWTRVGTNVALPFGFTVGLSAEFRWTNYESGWAPFVPDNSAREDQTRILQATLLNRALTVYGFSPQVAFSNQVRESNAQLFDFKRNLVEMRFVRQF